MLHFQKLIHVSGLWCQPFIWLAGIFYHLHCIIDDKLSPVPTTGMLQERQKKYIDLDIQCM